MALWVKGIDGAGLVACVQSPEPTKRWKESWLWCSLPSTHSFTVTDRIQKVTSRETEAAQVWEGTV